VRAEDQPDTSSGSAPSTREKSEVLPGDGTGQVPGGNSGPEDGGAINKAQAVECEKLRQLVRELQEERERDRQTIAALQAERDDYIRGLHAWAWQQVSPEELQRWAEEEEENGLSFSQVLEALDQQRHP